MMMMMMMMMSANMVSSGVAPGIFSLFFPLKIQNLLSCPG
jgi:hypothetical protein